MAECVLFADMGTEIAFAAADGGELDAGLVITPFFYTLIARVVSVVLLTWLLNLYRKNRKRPISWIEQLALVWCGLRGGIAFSLASAWAPASQITLSAAGLVLSTVFVYGLTMRPLIVIAKVPLEPAQADASAQTL